MLSGADQAAVTIDALLANAKRLGLLSSYRLGSVFANSAADGRIMVILDNDLMPVPAFNYAGALGAGQRVITIAIPPHGLYVIGVLSANPLPLVETFSVTGVATWTKPTGLVYADIQVQAAGGAGGGAATTIAGQWSGGDGGGGGEYARGTFLASQLGATETVTVGQGGIAVSAGVGGNGTGSSFGSLITCVGGGGGGNRTATTTLNYSANTQTRGGGGGGAGGLIRVAGSPGSMFIGINSTPQGIRGGDGGQSFLAGGRVENLNGPGNPGRAVGGGGSGAGNAAGSPAVPGGTGADGMVIVTSYFA